MTCSPSNKALLFWRLLMLLYLTAVLWVCFSKPDSLPTVQQWNLFIPFDKFVHFCLFLPFPIVAFFSLNLKRKPTRRSALAILALLLLGFMLAGLTEFIQGLTEYRDKDVMDFVADAAGLIASSCLLALYLLFSGKSRTRSY